MMINQPPYASQSLFVSAISADQLSASLDGDPVITGICMDHTTTNRPGARLGPAAIRNASYMLCECSPWSKISLRDGGDFVPTAYNIEGQIMGWIADIVDRRGYPITLGGDHSITYPILHFLKEFHHAPIPLIMFDAHPDTWDSNWGETMGHGTWLRRAIESGIVDAENSYIIGVRSSMDRETEDWTRHNTNLYTVYDMPGNDGLGGVARHVKQKLQSHNTPIYLSIDIDVLDPAFAPGTGTPEVGGFNTRELISALRELVGLRYAGMDMVEVSPPYDHSQITALAAARLVQLHLEEHYVPA